MNSAAKCIPSDDDIEIEVTAGDMTNLRVHQAGRIVKYTASYVVDYILGLALVFLNEDIPVTKFTNYVNLALPGMTTLSIGGPATIVGVGDTGFGSTRCERFIDTTIIADDINWRLTTRNVNSASACPGDSGNNNSEIFNS